MADEFHRKYYDGPGRPPVDIDLKILANIAERQWTITEIAAFLNVSTDTIYRRGYLPLIEEARERGKAKLRDMQWKKAGEGDRDMIKWLGKQYLKQSEKVEQKVSAEVNHSTEEKVKTLNQKIQSLVQEKSEWEKQLLPPDSN